MFKWVRDLLAMASTCAVLANPGAGVVAQAPTVAGTSQWQAFRGPSGLGVAVGVHPPTSFDAKTGKNVRWKVSLPKQGMSSPIVSGELIFLTGADDQSRQIYALAADKGDLRWAHDVQGLPDEPAEGTLPRVLEQTGYAAPTPTTNGSLVAAVFATGELACVDFKGQRIWSKHLGVPKNHYGHASSLLNDGDRLYVQFDHGSASKLYAFDFATGQVAWQVDRKEIGWSSPVMIQSNGRRELVLVNSQSVDSYDPKTGTPLWHVDCLAGEVASSPAYSDGLVVVASDGSAASGIDTSAMDDASRIRWQWDASLPDASSPVAHDGLVIIPTAFGVVSCLDIKTGTMHWEHPFDTGFSSSPIIVDGQVFLADLSGKMQIFKLSREFELVGECDLGEAIYSTPAFAGDRIYIRSLERVFCIAPAGP